MRLISFQSGRVRCFSSLESFLAPLPSVLSYLSLYSSSRGNELGRLIGALAVLVHMAAMPQRRLMEIRQPAILAHE